MRAHILNAYVSKLTKNRRRVGLTKAEAPTRAVGAFCDLRHILKKPRNLWITFGRVVACRACRPQAKCD
jgi:hypothetical protein